MAKVIRNENLILNMIVNGDPARNEMNKIMRSTRDLKIENEKLLADREKLNVQGKKDTQQYKQLTAAIKANEVQIKKNNLQVKEISSSLKVTSMTVDELTRRKKKLKAEMRTALPGTAEYKRYVQQLREVNTQLAVMRNETKAAKSSVGGLGSQFKNVAGKVLAWAAALFTLKHAITQATDAYAELDDKMKDVMKTTQLSQEEVELLNDKLYKVDTRTSQNELLDLGRIAGKLGITGVDNVLEFVRAADKLNVALGEDLGDNVEDVIREVGKLNEIFKVSETYGLEDGLIRIGSAINDLGAASVANEGYLVEFAKRVAGVASNADISIQNVLGLAATLDILGQSSEVSGTAYGQVITGMYKRTDAFAAAANMSLKDFTKLLNEDVNEAFIRVLEGIGGGGSMQQIVDYLDSLNLDGQRTTQVMSTLADNTERLREQQDLANKSFAEGTSVINEFNVKNSSALAIQEKHKKAIKKQIVDLGEKLLPIANSSLSVTQTFLKTINTLFDWVVKYKGVIIALVAVYAGYNVLLKAHNGLQKLKLFWSTQNIFALRREVLGLAGATKGTMLLSAAKSILTGSIRGVIIAMKAFIASIGPIGWVVGAIGLVVTAMSFLRVKTKETVDIIEDLSSATDIYNNSIKSLESSILRYDELQSKINSKVELTKKEHSELDGIMNTMLTTVPNLRGAFDEYGNALSVNIEAVKAYSKTQKEAYKDVLEHNIDAAEKEKKILENRMEYQRKIFQENKKPITKTIMTSMIGEKPQYTRTVVGHEDYSLKDVAKAREEWTKIKNDLDKLNTTIVDSKNILNGVIANLNEDGDPDPNPDGDDDSKDSQTWSLSSDKAFLEKRLALKQQYLDGEIVSESEYKKQLLQLEIDTYQKRIALNIGSESDILSIKEQFADKLIEQSKQTQQEQDAMNKEILAGEEDLIAKENTLYEQKKQQYAGNTKMLEIIEKNHKRAITKIQLDSISETLKSEETAYQNKRRQTLINQQLELQRFVGTKQGKERLQKQHLDALTKLDSEYLQTTQKLLEELISSGNFENINIDNALLSEEEKQQLIERLLEVKELLAELGIEVGELQYSFMDGNVDILGFTADDWELLFDHIKAGEVKFKDLIVVIGALGEAYKMYDKFVSAAEDRSLAEFKKSNDEKKKELEDRLDSGSISDEEYREKTAELDEEYEAKKKEIELAQAKRAKAAAVVDAIIGTAVSVTKVLSNPFLAAAVGILGAAQIALILAQPIEGAEDGGGIFPVTRAQDGKKYNATFNPSKRGYINKPTVLVGEAGPEYVVPNEALANPTIAPILSTFETARQQGKLASVDMTSVLPHYYINGFATGGFTSPSPPNLTSFSQGDVTRLTNTLDKINTFLNNNKHLDATVTMVGPNGIIEKMEEYDRVKNRANIK